MAAYGDAYDPDEMEDAGAFGDDGFEDDMDEEHPDAQISQNHSWEIIRAFFKDKGLVKQQLDSFDLFVETTLQEIIEDTPHIEIRPNRQYAPGDAAVDPNVGYRITFGGAYLSKPTHNEEGSETSAPLFPSAARLRNLTYESNLFLEMTCQPFDTDTGEAAGEADEQTLLCGSVPTMVMSRFCRLYGQTDKIKTELGECVFDQGGYFVINGSEKVIIALERQSYNRVYCFEKKQPSKFSWVGEVRSRLDRSNRPISSLDILMYTSGGGRRGTHEGNQIRARVPYIREDIPIVILFRALGCVADKKVLDRVVYDLDHDPEMVEMFRPSLEEAFVVQSRDVALDHIGRRGREHNIGREARVRHAEEILQKEMLPHVGISEDVRSRNRKSYFLGYVVHRLLQCALGRHGADDRDHFGNKRMDMAGPLIAYLFRQLFYKLTKDMRNYLQRCVDRGARFNLPYSVKDSIIRNGLRYSLATGNWGDRKSSTPPKTGVSQVLNRLTFASTLSHLRRLNTPIGREGKIAKPRQLHNTHWGMVCPCETPEGQAVGLVKNLSLMAYVSVGSDQEPVMKVLDEMSVQWLEEVEANQIPFVTKVFVNGNWVGVCDPETLPPEDLARQLRDRRRRNHIQWEVSVVHDVSELELQVFTDAGRVCRPLFVVNADQELAMRVRHLKDIQQGKAGFMSLVNEGLIEYIDTQEEECAMIAMKPDNLLSVEEGGNEVKTYTHCEIHPSMILGVCASIIPFPDHNQSPRNTYQSAMGKQAMGVYASNFLERIDTMASVLYYAQKPLVATRAMEHLRFRELPAGINATVAICCYTGYNQEDSLIMNQSSIDRGFFRSVFYRGYVEAAKRGGGGGGGAGAFSSETFERPNPFTTTGMKVGSYDKLEPDGLVPPGEAVASEDVIIGRTVTLPPMAEAGGIMSRFNKRDTSVVVRHNETGVIDRVMLTTNRDGERFTKVRIRSVRVPQIGDKFASRHGQKGTIGMTYRMEDMPWSREGVVPDIIVNPHAIPSRMTIGHLIECLMGKVMTQLGFLGDATPFSSVTVEYVAGLLHEHGYQRNGNEVMFNGHTGRKLEAQVFLGPTYYQRLKHMVGDKVHARARGPVALLTRQPMEGRSRDGGLRFGEMERDCIIAHGTAQLLQERTFLNSDPYRVHVCDTCGLIAVADTADNSYKCTGCSKLRRRTSVSQIFIPYACKLLFQELMAMSIAPRMLTLPHATGARQ
uniref:DNA-directed RNA polymerase subunit beta n=1 Tax=Bicosoecida sp. CB-2014 TaxID=1486930 RepID=A0A7S1C2I4_9STRA